MIKKLRCKKGGMNVLTVAIVISIILFGTVIMEYLKIKTITSHVEDILQSATISTLTLNYENMYSTNREGYVAGYLYEDEISKWERAVDYGDIEKEISNLLDLKKDGVRYLKISDTGLEYTISNLRVDIKSPYLYSDSKDKFIVESTIDFEIPYSSGWDNLPPIRLKLKTNSEHMVMF